VIRFLDSLMWGLIAAGMTLLIVAIVVDWLR